MQTATTLPPTLKVRFNKPQARAWKHFKDGNVVVLPWGRGVGKSEFMLICMLLLVAMYDYVVRAGMPHAGVRIFVLMPALTQARKGLLRRFRAKLYSSWKFLGGHINEVELIATFPGGSYIQFVSQEQRELLRSMRCDVVFVDEGDDILKSTYRDFISPWLSEPFSLQRRMVGGTPTQGRKGLLFELYDLARVGFARHFGRRATWRDAPGDVSPEYVAAERAKAQRNGTMAAFLREWECDFNSNEGLIYPMFQNLHVREPWKDVEPTEVLVGVDHGWEHPGTMIVAKVFGNGEDAVVHVCEEVYASKREETWWIERAEDIKKRYGDRTRFYADPSRPDRIEAFRKRAGIKIEPAANSVLDGISAVADRMSVREASDGRLYTRLLISPSCTSTLDELGKYRWKQDPRDKERFHDEPEKVGDDAADALRYLVFSRFGKPAGSRSESSNYHFG